MLTKKIALLPISLVFLALASAGCQTMTNIGLSGDASMRVEVEVYNGPLSKHPDTQLAELSAMLHIADVGLLRMRRDAQLSQCRLGCFGRGTRYWKPTNVRKALAATGVNGISSPKSTNHNLVGKFDHGNDQKPFTPGDCDVIDTLGDHKYQFLTKHADRHIQVCPTLRDIEFVTTTLQRDVRNLIGRFPTSFQPHPPTKSDVRLTYGSSTISDPQQIAGAAKIGSVLTNLALLLTAEEIRVPSDSVRAKTELAQFANAAAEIGKSISNRADALLLQKDAIKGVDSSLLANNLYLSTASPTDFSNLFEWLNAGTNSKTNSTRTKALQRLINDTHWAKVNTVYAYGRGKVRMAFIKDDIGNWDLKSFENDPSELLNAYKDIGYAALKEATKLATNTATSGKAELLANLGTRIATGQSLEPAATADMSLLRGHTSALLKQAQADARIQATNLGDQITTLDGDIREKSDAIETLEAKISSREAENQRLLLAYQNADDPEKTATFLAWNTGLESKAALDIELATTKDNLTDTKNQRAAAIAQQVTIPASLKRRAEQLLTQYKNSIEAMQSNIAGDREDQLVAPSGD